MLIQERKKYELRLEAEISKLKIEFLQQQLDQERGVTRLRPVPPAAAQIA